MKRACGGGVQKTAKTIKGKGKKGRTRGKGATKRAGKNVKKKRLKKTFMPAKVTIAEKAVDVIELQAEFDRIDADIRKHVLGHGLGPSPEEFEDRTILKELPFKKKKR